MDKNNIMIPLLRWREGGIKELTNGTILICNVPHIAPQAWLHRLYNGLDETEISNLEETVKLPYDFISFLRVFNGFHLFSNSISIWGKRKSYERKGENIFQPHDLLDLNQELKGEIPSSWLVIGSYPWDGSKIAYDLEKDEKKVFRFDAETGEIYNTWESIFERLNIEIERLSAYFDSKGIEIEEDIPTTP
jgi:hypothetical protein